MAVRDAAIAAAGAYFDDGGFVADLGRLVALRTESQVADNLGPLRAYLEAEMIPMLEGLGCACTVLDNPAPGGGPFLVAERHEGDDLPTVLTYGHGDVIRGQDAAWRDGLAPFALTVEGERLYGRGTADNKGQHLVNLRALRAVLETRGRLGFNLKALIETGEETGSPGLRELCAAERERLKADVLIASDGPRLQPDRPTLFMGARGAVNFVLRVRFREGAHHSGNFGGLIADPSIVLAHALATITGPKGEIRVEGWRPDSLTPDIRAALAELPVGGAGPEVDPTWGEPGLSPAERAFGWNSFAVLAMTSGVPEAPVNAIAGEARATCQLRFVVGTDPARILPDLRAHLDASGFGMVGIEPAREGFFPATRLPPDHPWVRFVAASLEEVTGKAPHILPNLAGLLPNDCFAEVLGMPTVWVPHSYAGCSQHAPNEHMLAPVAREALLAMTGLFWDIGETGGPR
ncbi:M20 family metallopeptidase [Oceaniglobus roseus]|uniref:M20 family metallopeptidase n=1 Tax=Oceaniglobus roseus TaxID=1737570 RepID=UPI000C7ED137|nr:M20 family metallopeptidase [Kandeliimicrobium roseum]